MANTAEGISVGDEQGLDPNNPADFEAIMAGRGVQVEEGEVRSPDRSITSGLTVAGPDQQRSPDGKFVSNQEEKPTETPPPAATDTSGAEENGDFADDPEIQEFLAKYDGDLDKALKGAANAQSLIGRRDEEREQEKRELAELRGQVQGLLAGGQKTPAQALSNEQVMEVASGRIESLGYEGAATEAANVAHASGDDRALATILEQWQVESPFAAMNFLTDFRLWQREQATAPKEEEAPAWQASAEDRFKVEQYGESLTSLKTELGEEAFTLVSSKLDEALDAMPANVLAMIDSTDPEARAEGFRIVSDRALRLASAAPAAAQVPAAASVERKLSGARVASGALRPAAKAPEAPTNREDAIKEFKRKIVEAPTTSISSGLTYGPTP